MPDVSHANPPPPANTQILRDQDVTAAMSQWAVAVLHDSSVPLFGVVRSKLDGVALVARKEWHVPDFQNSAWHHGVTLYRDLGGPVMNRTTALGRVGARGTDSLTLIDTPAKAQAMKASSVDFVLQYIGTVTAPVVDIILDAGLAFMAVTRANHFDGASAVAELNALNLSPGCTVWLDVEDDASVDPAVLKQKIDAWAVAITAAGFEAGAYIGAACPLTSVELYKLKVTRYWKSQSRILDRNGELAEPSCGWCMLQTFPSVIWADTGINVDVDIIQQDYRNRLPSWVVRAG